MAIGERNLRGMTQKYLGIMAGLPERTADIRMAQYEAGTRTPKEDLTKALAHALDVSPDALTVPDIDTYIGLMHTLFALEDIYGLTIEKRDGEILMRIDPFKSREARNLLDELPRVGAKCVKNTARAKSARTITTSGAITILSMIRPGIG